MSAARFVALPSRAEAANVYLLAAAFGLTFLVLYGGASALSAWVPWRVPVALPLDARWPFVPAAAIVYLTISPMLLLAPLVLRDLAGMLPLFAALMLETVIAAVCFMLLPVEPPAIACCEPGVIGTMFHVADAINLERNYLPSLHVAFAFTLAAAFAPRAPRAARAPLFGWALAVAVSTLLTRQHFLLDVLCGIALAGFAWRLAGGWALRPEVLAAFDVELLCLRNFAVFVGRHRRYLAVTLAVLLAGVPRWRRQRLVRTGFAFLQAFDDLMDGDRQSPREPLDVADELLAAFDTGVFADHDLARLGAAFRADLLARGGPGAIAIATTLLRRMREDRERVRTQRLSNEPELAELHGRTFCGSLDLMLLAADSPLRASDVPEMVEALGWCSPIRDLGDDLAQGLINLPSDVALAARAERPQGAPASWMNTQAVRAWLLAERLRGRDLLKRAEARLETLGNPRGVALLRRFAGSMRRYTHDQSSASSGAAGRLASSTGGASSRQRTT